MVYRVGSSKNVLCRLPGYPPIRLIFSALEMPLVSIEMIRKNGSPLEMDPGLAKLNTRNFTRKA